jgi:NADH-quinone oxidoreductase subunit C
MREYKPKGNVQKKAYYKDRFWVSPCIEKEEVSDEIFKGDLQKLKDNFVVKESYIQRGHLVIIIEAKENKKVLKFLKETLAYDMLMELSAIDYLEQEGKFEVFYELLSLSKRRRVRVKCKIKENESIESVVEVFKSADWSEREMYDMFGIKANNHPYLKRLLMPEDWVGYPLRKTYPLEGDEAARWYEIDKIFGKEYREVVGEEIRDAAWIQEENTELFARIKKEVPRGAQYKKDITKIESFNEDAPLIETFELDKAKVVSRDR